MPPRLCLLPLSPRWVRGLPSELFQAAAATAGQWSFGVGILPGFFTFSS